MDQISQDETTVDTTDAPTTTITSDPFTLGVASGDPLADSVILRFEGRDFRLRALNSWVNL